MCLYSQLNVLLAGLKSVCPLLILRNLRSPVILTPSAWAASFNNSNVVYPCPHYSLVGPPCPVEVLELLGYCVHIKNKAFLAISSILLKNDPFLDCAIWMSDRQKQLMCSQLGYQSCRGEQQFRLLSRLPFLVLCCLLLSGFENLTAKCSGV